MENIVKEFYKLDKNKPTVGLLVMVKNEESSIEKTLKSVVGYVDAIIIYDTGSTDNTINIISTFCEEKKINLYLKKGTFVNFSVSRNVSLDFADTIDIHYILLLDSNDELRGGEKLKETARQFLSKENNAFLVCQQWWSGNLDKYYNIRFVKARCGWRYMGSVHEWMKDTKSPTSASTFPVIRLTDDFCLYQDRTVDGQKSFKRFTRDRELLLEDLKKDPKEARSLFYLAQTCQCLGLHDECLYYSKLRLELVGFVEERFHSYMRCGVSSMMLGLDWYDCIKWFLKAYEEFYRAEPLIKIADYYRQKAEKLESLKEQTFNIWNTAYFYIEQACKIPYPEHCILFVDKGAYDYQRWHLMGIIAYYTKNYAQGKEACLKAIATNKNLEQDKKNLQFYLDKEKEGGVIQTQNIDAEEKKMTKAEYVNKKMGEMRLSMPKASLAQIEKRVNEMWKKYNKK